MEEIVIEKLNVLSLCDGMSCGQIALQELGIHINNYYASEIKEVAIKVTQNNFPKTVQIGDLNWIRYSNGILYSQNGQYRTKIDLVIFGSPCQTFSVACKTDKRIGLGDKEKSGLFLECYRILKEVNPKYFLVENVVSMKNEDKDYLSDKLGVQPIKIDSGLISPCLRKRYYWTNIPDVTIPAKINHCLQDILDNGYTDREKGRSLLVSDSRPLTTPVKMFHRYYSIGFTTLIFKNKQHYDESVAEYIKLSNGKRKITAKDLDDYNGNVFDGVRYMNQDELEKCQTVPQGYTSCLNRNEAADVLGDGWNIETIKHIFKGLKSE